MSLSKLILFAFFHCLCGSYVTIAICCHGCRMSQMLQASWSHFPHLSSSLPFCFRCTLISDSTQQTSSYNTHNRKNGRGELVLNKARQCTTIKGCDFFNLIKHNKSFCPSQEKRHISCNQASRFLPLSTYYRLYKGSGSKLKHK